MEKFVKLWESGANSFSVHTSGSTGAPKDITLFRSDMIHSAQSTCVHFGLTAQSVLGCPLSFDYIAGKMMGVRAWVSGGKLIPLEISNTFDLPEGEHFDLLCIVPSMIPNLLKHPAWAMRVSNVLIGGAAPTPSSLKALTDCGFHWEVSYGMTETCSHVALAADDGIYHAMPGVTFATDEQDCLIINAPGYTWKSLTTNDVVELLDERAFIWKGRIDGVINSGGIKLFPEELERLYEPFLAGIEFAVTSRQSASWGEEVVIVTTSAKTLIECVLTAANIPGYKRPKAVVEVTELPRTSNGKIDRKGLKALGCCKN